MSAEGLTEAEKNAKVALFASQVDEEISRKTKRHAKLSEQHRTVETPA